MRPTAKAQPSAQPTKPKPPKPKPPKPTEPAASIDKVTVKKLADPGPGFVIDISPQFDQPDATPQPVTEGED